VFQNLLVGEATANLLNGVIDVRNRIVPEGQIVDCRYQDLISEPVATVKSIYDAFGMRFDEAAANRIRDYLAYKPKDKFGRHNYQPMAPDQVRQNRPYFRRYQETYNVPDEI